MFLPFNHHLQHIRLEGKITASAYNSDSYQLAVGTVDGRVHFVELAGASEKLAANRAEIIKYFNETDVDTH